MNKILILNFGTTHDLISSSHLISAVKKDHPTAMIELLTLRSQKEIAQILDNISNYHYIDSDSINTIFQSPLYSDAFAINQFMNILGPLVNTDWDLVVNNSNDNISSYIMSALKTNQLAGSYIANDGVARCSDKWSIYQNYVATGLSRQTINKPTIRNHIVNLPYYSELNKIKLNSDYTTVANQNFARIRKMKNNTGIFIVGISLEAGYDGYMMELDTYSDIIEALEESNDYKAVLLLNGKEYQKEFANKLNKTFNNKLISINLETVALPSVISNLDIIISASNDQLTISDTMNTRCLEIRDCGGNSATPSIVNANNFVLYAKDETNIASDALLALNEEFGTELPINVLNSCNPVYRSVSDELGNFFTQIRGDLNIQKELRYHVERSYFFEIFGYPRNNELFEHIKNNTEPEYLQDFIINLKNELTNTVKLLLATVRSLKSVRNSESSLNSFISYLDNLMAIGKENTIVSSIVRNFEGKLENIEAIDANENIRQIESYLFELKSDMQILTNIMEELTNNKSTEQATLSTDSKSI
ncbi:MAG: hypothetical protein HON90_05390 [Halobacteriovoraceae bacterium]|jgi:ADP-heptose:LPS heptosyltransferase|nr:hypothetical protein [Halobacteriovoraceae bacterium]